MGSNLTATPSSTALRIRASEFDPTLYPRGHKHKIDLVFTTAIQEFALPVLLARGVADGKTLVITAGVHGDEFEGIRAILEVFAELDPGVIRGTVMAVPVANPPAFWRGARTSPMDEGNLARSFPGQEQGSPTQMIAFHLGQSIIAHADFYLDLHSAGVKLLMPTMVGYDANDPRSSDAALAFGAPIVWGHTTVAAGRTISFASCRGIPWLYTEARGAGRVDREDLSIFKSGILNLLRHLKILPGVPGKTVVQRSLSGDGDIDAALKAAYPGFFVPSVELLDDVHQGQELGRTVNLHGELVELFRAPSDGVVGMIHVFPVVDAGESVFLLANSSKLIV